MSTKLRHILREEYRKKGQKALDRFHIHVQMYV